MKSRLTVFGSADVKKKKKKAAVSFYFVTHPNTVSVMKNQQPQDGVLFQGSTILFVSAAVFIMGSLTETDRQL